MNHVSLLCRSVKETVAFYEKVLGFISIVRPGSFNFDGAWLFGHGIGIHLLLAEDPEKIPTKNEINTKDKHISFQCDESMDAVEKYLKDMKIGFKRAMVEENGIQVDQLFFHDPDGFMIEICNCDSLPVIPLAGGMVRSCPRLNLESIPQQTHQVEKQIWSWSMRPSFLILWWWIKRIRS